jgi:hypothetical protein
MKNRLRYILGTVIISIGMYSIIALSQPSFNGTTPGCSGGGCHTHSAGKASIVSTNNLSVSVQLLGISNGTVVAGELVDQNGVVAAVNNGTTSNPFTLTATQAGIYLINLGMNSPSRIWDSVSVNLGATDVTSENPPARPQQIQLCQNYPNPFNPATTISFTLPRESFVSLKVFDSAGREVMTLASKVFQAGYQSIRWNAVNIPSGVYFYRLQVGSEIESKKLVLIR